MEPYKAYAGIGSTETPIEVLDFMEIIAVHMAERDWTLRSGHAPGADRAFEKGCDKANGKKEIYLPWKGFEGSDSPFYEISQEAFFIAAKYHPKWENVTKAGARKLLARDGYQVLGQTLDSLVRGVFCWTKGGRGEGGTGQALRIAAGYDIPILDLGVYKDFPEAITEVDTFITSIS